jgi:hypothetical protein
MNFLYPYLEKVVTGVNPNEIGVIPKGIGMIQS